MCFPEVYSERALFKMHRASPCFYFESLKLLYTVTVTGSIKF